MSLGSPKESARALISVITMYRTLVDFDVTIIEALLSNLNEMVGWFLGDI